MDHAPSPYRPAPGSLPPVLAGRNAELYAIEAAIAQTQQGAPAQPIVLIGLRGMGKTALLREAALIARNRGAVVLYGEASPESGLVDAFSRSLDRARKDVGGLPERIRNGIKRVLESVPQLKYELPADAGAIALEGRQGRAESFLSTVDRISHEAWKNDSFVVLCIDEVQDAPLEELRPLITYVHETSGTSTPVLLLCAGLPGSVLHLHDARTYTERWRFFTLDLLSKDETNQAIDKPARDHNVVIDSPALNLLTDASGGYPFFIQEYGSAAWQKRSGNRIAVVDARNAIASAEAFLDESFYAAKLKSLTPREIRYCLVMADLGAGAHTVADVARKLGTTSTVVNSIRNQLIKKDVAYSPAPRFIQFRIPLTERYIAAHRGELEEKVGALI